jgi:hypothetical protein
MMAKFLAALPPWWQRTGDGGSAMRSVLLAFPIVAALGVAQARAQELIWTRDGVATDERRGDVVADAGDVDGDGIEDVLATARYGAAFSNGDVEVYRGSDGTLLLHLDAPDANDVNFATSADGVGDLDGDGFDDVVVGDYAFGGAAMPRRGAFHAFSGKDGSVLYRQLGAFAGAFFGWRVRRLGDLDGDGRPEFLVSADEPSGGSVSVRDGATGDEKYAVYATNSSDHFGSALASIGDLDGDGLPDFAVGTEFRNYVRLFSGATGTMLRELHSPDAYPFNFGSRIAIGGDLDGDGIPETFVADPYRDDGTVPGAGIVYVFAGSDGSLITRLRTNHGIDYEYFGFAVAAIPDANGDGVGDVAISKFDHQHGGVMLFSGRTAGLLYTFDGYTNQGQFGTSLAGVRDADGDGLGEVMIGSPMHGTLNYGTIELRLGHALFLDVEPATAVAGDLVTRTVREGVPANKVGVALVAIDGTPTFVFLEGLGAFDGAGSYELDVNVPPGLGPMSLDFQGFAIDGRGRVAATTVERIELQ